MKSFAQNIKKIERVLDEANFPKFSGASWLQSLLSEKLIKEYAKALGKSDLRTRAGLVDHIYSMPEFQEMEWGEKLVRVC